MLSLLYIRTGLPRQPAPHSGPAQSDTAPTLNWNKTRQELVSHHRYKQIYCTRAPCFGPECWWANKVTMCNDWAGKTDCWLMVVVGSGTGDIISPVWVAPGRGTSGGGESFLNLRYFVRKKTFPFLLRLWCSRLLLLLVLGVRCVWTGRQVRHPACHNPAIIWKSEYHINIISYTRAPRATQYSLPRLSLCRRSISPLF